MDKKNILISFSGGRTSAFMAKFIQENPKYSNYNKLFIFANTGRENEKTLEFVHKCDVEFGLNLVWVEAVVDHRPKKGTTYKVVSFETANRSGSVFEEVVVKYGLPSKLYRHCTRELKEAPIHKYAKDFFKSNDYVSAIGIRADEKHRIGSDPSKIYPLSELNIDETFIRTWWDRQKFNLELKDYEGNCDLCFLKSVRKKLTLIYENPSIAEWWSNIEQKYSQEQQPIFDVYRNLSISDLVEMAKKPFQKQLDKHELRSSQHSMFDIDLDVEFDCFCKMN